MKPGGVLWFCGWAWGLTECAWSLPLHSGYGGRGHAVDIKKLSVAQRQKYDLGYKRFHANEYISNLIPIQRKIKNVLEPEWVCARHSKSSYKLYSYVQRISRAVPWVSWWRALCSITNITTVPSIHVAYCFSTKDTVPSLNVLLPSEVTVLLVKEQYLLWKAVFFTIGTIPSLKVVLFYYKYCFSQQILFPRTPCPKSVYSLLHFSCPESHLSLLRPLTSLRPLTAITQYVILCLFIARWY